MLVSELYELVRNEKKPVVRTTEKALEYNEDAFDPEMLGRIIGASREYEDMIRFEVGVSEFEQHNRSVALPRWSDNKGGYTFTWFETDFYPKDGIEVLYFPENIEVPLEFVENDSIFMEYINLKIEKSYIEWLEEQVQTFRKLTR